MVGGAGERRTRCKLSSAVAWESSKMQREIGGNRDFFEHCDTVQEPKLPIVAFRSAQRPPSLFPAESLSSSG